MAKVFGDMKPGDKIYLVGIDTRDGKIFKIRTVDVKDAHPVANLGNFVVVKFLMIEVVAQCGKTSCCSGRGTKTFIKAFTTIEEAREDYKARLLAEIGELTSKANALAYRIGLVHSDLRQAMIFNNYNETKA